MGGRFLPIWKSIIFHLRKIPNKNVMPCLFEGKKFLFGNVCNAIDLIKNATIDDIIWKEEEVRKIKMNVIRVDV